MELLYAILILGGMGLFLGLALALASRFLAPEKDDRLDRIMKALPGRSCEQSCGYDGCGAYAAALLEGAPPGLCQPGGEDLHERLCEIMGAEMIKNTRLTALVRCSGGLRARNKFEYAGIADCNAAMKISNGPKECVYGCIGLGTCEGACPSSAISVVDGVAVVDHERCAGCLVCLRACPKGIIIPVPYYADVNVACSSLEKGAPLRKLCDIGCLGCRICEKICQSGAIAVEDNLARIDFDKCTGCGDCAEKCPRKLIVDAKLDRGPRECAEDL